MHTRRTDRINTRRSKLQLTNHVSLLATFACLALASAATAQPQPPADPARFTSPADLFDLARLPRLKPFKTYMASSFDRKGGNYDWGEYETIQGKEGVVFDVTGPGMITRAWSANAAGTIRIYLDGDPKPAIQDDFAAFLQKTPVAFGHGRPADNSPELQKALADHDSFGHTSYCVIPFTKGCRVTLSDVPDIYYQFNYLLFDEPHGLPTYTPEWLDQTKPIFADIRKALTFDPRTPAAENVQIVKGRTPRLEPGAKAVILDRQGSFTIRSLAFKVRYPQDEHQCQHLREKLLLRARWDEDITTAGGRGASIKTPLACFFMDYGLPSPVCQDYTTAMIGRSQGWYRCRFPMPVRQHGLIELINDSALPMSEIDFEIGLVEEPWTPSTCHFKALYHAEDSTFGRDSGDYAHDVMYRANTDGKANYTLLRTWGRGHFVGFSMLMDGRETPFIRGMGEADEAVFVDGDPRRTMWGTGSEDCVNDAWGIHPGFRPLGGGAVADDRMLFYRLHLSDCIPFSRTLAFTWEHGSSNNCSTNYKSVAYYYLSPDGINHTQVDDVPPRDVNRYLPMEP